MSTPAPTRIYVVANKATKPDEAGQNRLVRASNVAQSIRHVAKDQLVATVASQDDLVRLVGAGTVIEVASTEVLPVGASS